MRKSKKDSVYSLAKARAALHVAAANAQRTYQYQHQTEEAIRNLDTAAFEYGRVAQLVMVGS